MGIVRNPAPAWKADAFVNGGFQTISSEELKGKYYVLVFYPLDFTFVCPTELIAFSDRAAEFEAAGAKVLGVSVDSKFAHQAWVQMPRSKGGLGGCNIPLVSDINKTISKAFDVLVDNAADGDNGLALRATVIVDAKGIVRSVTVNDLGVGRSVDETLRVLQAFNYVDTHGEEVCPAGWKAGECCGCGVGGGAGRGWRRRAFHKCALSRRLRKHLLI